jgi:uncharacterized protein (DUF983 family)
MNEKEHAVALVGRCPFCESDFGAELWRNPADGWLPYQVRCRDCGARGGWADCGDEVAVFEWQRVVVTKPEVTQ